MNKNNISNICNKYLSDKQFLLYMIPHHEIAISISKKLQKISTSPIIQTILREIIWSQTREVMMMKDILYYKLPENISNTNLQMTHSYRHTIFDLVESASDPNAECKPEYFDIELHKKHVSNMKLNDKNYLHHMIPHHQVAVYMSKNLLNYTNNDFMIQLAYTIIRNQQKEISYMNNLLQNMKGWSWKSYLIN